MALPTRFFLIFVFCFQWSAIVSATPISNLTFKSGLNSADSVAKLWSPDARLAGIKAQEDLLELSEPTGYFESISFFFYADSIRGNEITVHSDGSIQTSVWTVTGFPLQPLESNYLNSTDLIGFAETGGGSQYRADKVIFKIVYYLGFTRHFREMPSGDLVYGISTINYYSGSIQFNIDELFELEIDPYSGSIKNTYLRSVKPFGLISKANEAKARVRFYSADAVLRGIKTSMVMTFPDDSVATGRFNQASYIFYSNGKGFFEVFANNEDEFRIIIPSFSSFLTLPEIVLESDSIIQITEAAGGKDFRKKYPLSVLTVRLSDLSGFVESEMPVENGLYWIINYSPLIPENPATHLIFFVDPSSGKILGKKLTSSGPEPSGRGPDKIKLTQNFPNPFNPTTQFSFSVQESGSVHIEFFDVLGKNVYRIDKGFLQPGTYNEAFSSIHLGSGIYFYRAFFQGARERKFSKTFKMIIAK